MNRERWWPIALVLVGMMSIQLGATLSKGLFPTVGPQGASTMRQVFAAAIACLVFRPWRTRLSGRQVRALILYGLSLSGMNLCIYIAMSRIPLGVAVTLEFWGPLAVALLGSRRGRDFFWVGLAVVGIALLLPLHDFSASLNPIGITFALGAGACWALYIVFGRRAGADLHGGTATALGMCVASLFVLPFGIGAAGARLLDYRLFPLALSVALLSSVIPYSLEMAALQKIPTRTFGILMSVEPAVGAFFGLLVLGERLTGVQTLAMLCVIAASAGSTATVDEDVTPSEVP